MTNRYDVNIAGYALTVMSERSANHMARLAETLNERVREIQRSGGTANYLHIVMLAAMELADEVLTLRDEVETLRKEREGVQDLLDRRSKDLLATLDSVLK